jgi:dynamin 1-like protein
LILQLINGDKEYAKFEHSPEIYYDFEKVQKEIEAETEREVGSSKAVSNSPILLKICSPNGKKSF